MKTEIKQPVQSFSQLLDEAIERERRTGIEICTSCARDMTVPSLLHVDHPARYVGGAYYCEGGQTCASCAAKMTLPESKNGLSL